MDSPNNKTRGMLAIALVAIVIGGTLYVLTNVENEEKRLRIAIKQGVEGAALKEIADSFNKEKHIPVEVVEYPYDQLYEVEQQQLKERRHNEIPPFDVVMVDDPWLYSLVFDPKDKNNRRLETLNDVLGDEAKGDYFRSTLSVCQYCPDDQQPCPEAYYALPFVGNSQLFAYRKADFLNSEVPTSWKEVLDTSEQIQRSGRLGYVTRIGPGNSIVTDFMPILWAYDSESFREHLHGDVLNEPEEAFKTLIALVGGRKNLGSASVDDFDVSAYLQKGGAAMGIVWSAWAIMLANVDENTSEELRSGDNSANATSERAAKLSAASRVAENSDHDVTKGGKRPAESNTKLQDKLPFGNVPLGPNGESIPELGAWLLAIPYNSDQKDKGKDFIRFATEFAKNELEKEFMEKKEVEKKKEVERKKGEQIRSTAWRGNPPPRESVLNYLANEPPFKKHPSLVPAIRWSLQHARARPRTACWKEIESRLGKNLEKLIVGELDAKRMKAQVNDDIGPLIGEENCHSFLREQAVGKDGKQNSVVRQ